MSEKQNDSQISKHDFYFELPLYEAVPQANLEENLFQGDVDGYSAANNIDTTYSIKATDMDRQYETGFQNFAQVKLVCKRKGNDILRFFVYVGNDSVVKFGQTPSLADLQFAEIGKKYNKHLSRQDLKEFKKAIGLAAHGVGAGSFVYLRRIFENLIYQTFKENEQALAAAKTDFRALRMDEKVELLKAFLPGQLVSMKKIYGILSKGVHELSEGECLAYFPALKLSIELILEQQIENEAKQQRDEEASRQIEEIQKKMRD